MTNSSVINIYAEITVVNCFQISNFVLWQTALIKPDKAGSWLWIAFKLVTLSYDKQHNGYFHIGSSVVNCFQISNFVLWQTARNFKIFLKLELWIAFKLVTLSYDKQQLIEHHRPDIVVNCFQISNFVLWQTAE